MSNTAWLSVFALISSVAYSITPLCSVHRCVLLTAPCMETYWYASNMESRNEEGWGTCTGHTRARTHRSGSGAFGDAAWMDIHFQELKVKLCLISETFCKSIVIKKWCQNKDCQSKDKIQAAIFYLQSSYQINSVVINTIWMKNLSKKPLDMVYVLWRCSEFYILCTKSKKYIRVCSSLSVWPK